MTDTVVNSGGIAAGASTTRHYLSADQRKDGNDRLFTGTRAVPALGAGGASTGTVTVWIPSNTALGPYVLLAGADDTIGVSVVNETNNCVASVTRITVTE